MTHLSLPPTEQQNSKTQALDQLTIAEIVQLMHQEDLLAVQAIAPIQTEIAATIETIVKRLRSGGRLFYIGAGTSGRLGVLDAAECPPTFRVSPELVQGVIAGGEGALVTAVEGAEDNQAQAALDLAARGLKAEDMLVGIAASGTTPYVRAALRYAHGLGCGTALIACNPIPQDDPAIAHYLIAVVGPEIITGSTRLKAGTVTKLILNMLSTITMVQLGKVYGNLMVDLKISNQKLQARAQRMVQELTGLEACESQTLLEQAQGEVKTALLMHFKNLDYTKAHQHLAHAKGQLRVALSENGSGLA